MALKAIGWGVLAGAVLCAAVTPASAEFFGCNEPHTKVSYSSPASRHATSRPTYTTRETHDYATRRTRSAGLFAPYPSRTERW
ncbi:MAG: hypothetical protein WC670_11415 [Pseudolabrys sp.]|jgi:hypothetical protein